MSDELKNTFEELVSADDYVKAISDQVYAHLYKDFSRVEDYMKSANERYHQEHAQKIIAIEKKINRGIYLIVAALLIVVIYQTLK